MFSSYERDHGFRSEGPQAFSYISLVVISVPALIIFFGSFLEGEKADLLKVYLDHYHSAACSDCPANLGDR